MELVGAPNICALVKVHKKDEEEILINKEKYNHRMVNEFVAFTEIFKQQDLTTCYKTLESQFKCNESIRTSQNKWQSRI